MVRTVVHPKNVGMPDKLLYEGRKAPYTHAARMNLGKTLLILAGQVALDSEGNLVGRDDLKAQITQIVKNIKTVLEAADASLKDVIYLRDNLRFDRFDEFAKISDWRVKTFPDLWAPPAPPATGVGVVRLASPDFLIEIEALAEVPAK